MIGDDLQIYTYEYILALCLNDISNEFDKREGSIIFDTLSPFSYRMATLFMEIRRFYQRTMAEYATGEDLDLRVKEQGIKREQATFAVKRADFKDAAGNPIAVPIGARFSTLSDINPVNYTVTAVYTAPAGGGAIVGTAVVGSGSVGISTYAEGVTVPGAYRLTCEVAGVVGNEYSGNLVNITFIRGIASAIMSDLLVPGQDIESDDALRERYFRTLEQKAFGGNIADYRSKVSDISGVGDLQVYPVWDGGGTVKLSIVDAQYNACSPEFVADVQNKVDPENGNGEQGYGLGLAPIDHKVTVVTPSVVSVNVTLTVTLLGSTTVGQVQADVEQAIEQYLLSLRRAWPEPGAFNIYSLSVFRSRINAATLSVAGIANVSSVIINGVDADLVLNENATTQEIPVRGTVIINAS